jgi:hypothetical protein
VTWIEEAEGAFLGIGKIWLLKISAKQALLQMRLKK